jgi:hypothetical protein
VRADVNLHPCLRAAQVLLCESLVRVRCVVLGDDFSVGRCAGMNALPSHVQWKTAKHNLAMRTSRTVRYHSGDVRPRFDGAAAVAFVTHASQQLGFGEDSVAAILSGLRPVGRVHDCPQHLMAREFSSDDDSDVPLSAALAKLAIMDGFNRKGALKDSISVQCKLMGRLVKGVAPPLVCPVDWPMPNALASRCGVPLPQLRRRFHQTFVLRVYLMLQLIV